jgi:putative dimethyl sulfoxide reductase chaperone
MRIDDLIIHESARRDIYQGLAQCYYLPDGNIAKVLEKMELHLGLIGSGALIHITLMRSQLQSSGIPDKLKIDFSRLFVGPYTLPAPPYGSVYLEGERKIMGESTIDALRHYSDAGLDISTEFKDAPDHIAAELEFMYYLVFKQIEAIRDTDRDSLSANLGRQRAFLQIHLGAWVEAFAKNVELHSETDFYRSLACATKTFIFEEDKKITILPIAATAAE